MAETRTRQKTKKSSIAIPEATGKYPPRQPSREAFCRVTLKICLPMGIHDRKQNTLRVRKFTHFQMSRFETPQRFFGFPTLSEEKPFKEKEVHPLCFSSVDLTR